jgi:antitoxin (DNA-binding transcriptional repressor) of toxin-antitoxin stability system
VATEITEGELHNSTDEIMRQLADGESFVVTRDGMPAAELSPLRRRRFVSARITVGAFQGSAGGGLEGLRTELDRAAS